MKTRYAIIHVCCLCLLLSCSKAFLEKKPDSALVVPRSLSDFSELLNNQLMQETSELAEVSADDFVLEHTHWSNFYDPVVKNAYVWAPDIYETGTSHEAWDKPYQQIFYANVVLDGIGDIGMTPVNEAEWKRVKGTALFVRAYAFYNLAQLFAPPYDSGYAESAPGIPLKLSADVNQRVERGSLAETYSQIITDLEQASTLLPDAVHAGRPSRAAAFAMLARTFLSMREYGQAGSYADKCLQLFSQVLDFNGLQDNSFNVREGIIYGTVINTASLITYYAVELFIPHDLYALYDDDDLRKRYYFRTDASGRHYKYQTVSYGYHFSGLSTEEVMLVKAEAMARAGHLGPAMEILDALLEKRFRKGRYVPVQVNSQPEAIARILAERRKELIFRALRWTDLRRLNLEGADITLTRELDGQVYSLRPNSPLSVLPIPPAEIALSGIGQNARVDSEN